MKFLCIECDEAMRLVSTSGPNDGSMTVTFACPACGRRTAMLTNAMETQVVRSLGVKIGGRTTSQKPMEMIRGALVSEGGAGSERVGAESSARRRDMSNADTPRETRSGLGAEESGYDVPVQGNSHAESRCPFTGAVNEAFGRRQQSLVWSDAARARVDRIPEYARRMVVMGVEQTAREQGLEEITESVLDNLRGRLGM